jgi:6-phosphogluconolactonase
MLGVDFAAPDGGSLMGLEQAKVECFPDRGSMLCRVAEDVVGRAGQAIAQRRRFLLTLSGGSTPQPLYELLATPPYASRIEWQRVHVFWGDERCVPPEHPESNYHMARKALLEHVPLLPANVHRMRGEDEPTQAADAYEQWLRRFFGVGDSESVPATSFDLVLLGMGTDGHTASLIPGSAAASEARRWVVASPGPQAKGWRLTLTPVLLNAAVDVMFLVSGAHKAEPLRVVLEERPRDPLPAQLIRPKHGPPHWMIDAAAASRLRGDYLNVGASHRAEKRSQP